jgi:diguanylate cyclase (GGDEF)-like protein/PAS domain S-box-containing protein
VVLPIDRVMSSEPASGQDALSASFTRNAAAMMTTVDDVMFHVLGWRPDQLVGRPSTDFIHPEDQVSAVGAWFAMLNAPGETRVWRGRYQGADGTWKWVESVNLNRLNDPDNPVVYSTMTLVSAEQVGFEEELRARRQLLSRLSDALPVGLFQIDADRQVTFTNDRFHIIVGCPPAATVEAQFAAVIPADLVLLEAVLSAVLGEQQVDDIDLRLRPSTTDGASSERVCELAMRPLTDSSGNVSGAIGCLSDVTERVQLRRELEIRATIDGLTSCLNRNTTLALLATTLARQADAGGATGVVFVDLDGFKVVNDRFGHAAGDRVLEIASRRLRSASRPDDAVGRVGGDEFLVICPNVENSAVALDIGRRLAETLSANISIGSDMVELRASIGVAWTDGPLDADAFVAQADSAMYQSKQLGQSTATLFTAPRPMATLERSLTAPLR